MTIITITVKQIKKLFHYTYLLWNPVGPASRLPDRLALMHEPAIAWWLAESRSLQQSSRMTPTRSRWLPLALRLFVMPTDISPMLGPMLGLIAWCPSVSTTLLVSPAAVTSAHNSLIPAHVKLCLSSVISTHLLPLSYPHLIFRPFDWHRYSGPCSNVRYLGHSENLYLLTYFTSTFSSTDTETYFYVFLRNFVMFLFCNI